MKLKRKEAGYYEGRPYFDHKAGIKKVDGEWHYVVADSTGKLVASGNTSTKRAAEYEIAKYGYDTTVEVRNIMSGNMVSLALNEVGGPCDPSTERYWSM